MDALMNVGAVALQVPVVALQLLLRMFASAVADPLRAGGVAACTVVLLACVCRINLLQFRVSRSAWFCVYLLFAVYALGVLLDLVQARWVDWYEGAGLGGLLLYMALTRDLWRHGPDPETTRGELRNADGTVIEDPSP
ncbi:MAG: hypothetical protein J0I65_07550 [Variovorax sp.]|nr:hypothetical protein [Variovorax sp.]|tara:strand:- start:271 stop:684 length:414 start_codon:yes stop_codon:yes gene_type:complete